MSYFSAITDVETYHNPNEGRTIINENFRKIISGVAESIDSITGGTSSASTLSQVLAQGNITGPNNIIISSGQTINSANGGGQIDLRANDTDGKVLITSDGGAEGESGFYVDSLYSYMFNNGYNKGFYLGTTESEWWNQDSDEDNQSIKITVGSAKPFIAHNNANNNRLLQGSSSSSAVGLNVFEALFLSGITNSVVLGGQYITASTSNTVYVPYLNVKNIYPGSPVYNLGIDLNGNIVTGSSASYVEYRANLTQASTNAPTANTLGTPTLAGGVWSYSDVGSYFFTKTGAFSAASNVEIEIENAQVYGYTMSNAAFSLISAAVYDDNTIEVRTSFWGSYPTTATTFNVVTPGASGASVTDAMSNDILSNTRFCVRIWS